MKSQKRIALDAISKYEKATKNHISEAKKMRPIGRNCLWIDTALIDKEYIDGVSQSVNTGSKNADKGSEFIYIFRIHGTTSLQGIISAIEKQKSIQSQPDYDGKKNLPAINKEHERSRILYLGRSRSMRSRFRQHTLGSKAGTYGLHLEDWSKPLKLRIKVSIYQFKQGATRAVQVLEDGLWDSLQPLLGRRGER
jgi:hypothetical protein